MSFAFNQMIQGKMNPDHRARHAENSVTAEQENLFRAFTAVASLRWWQTGMEWTRNAGREMFAMKA